MILTRRLLGVLGKRAFRTFAVVTFLMAGLLATVNLASRHALKLFVDDQLERTPWDLLVLQSGIGDLGAAVPDRIRDVDGVTQVETVALLRAKLSDETSEIMIDGQPLFTPWLSLLAATDMTILPPQLQTAQRRGSSAGTAAAILALVGPERAMGDAFLALQGAHEFRIDVKTSARQGRVLFSTPLAGVIRLDRDELTRWLMDQMGSAPYIPFVGAVLLMSYDLNSLSKFDALAQGMIQPEMVAAPEPMQSQHVQQGDYIPEIMHLARIDRPRLVSGWDIPRSLEWVTTLGQNVEDAARAAAFETSPDGWQYVVPRHPHGPDEPHTEGCSASNEPIGTSDYIVDSTTLVLLSKMGETARLIGIVTILVATPLLWVGWMLAANLSGLLMLNERRTLGLMRLRGVPGRTLGRTMLIAITAGGLLGGGLGLIGGSVLPLLVYERGRLPSDVLFQPQQVLLSVLFLIVTVILALLVSRRLVRYATTISPLEASGRIAGSEAHRNSN